MPYVSKAQARKFHSDPRLQKYAAEFDKATEAQPGGFRALPERHPTAHFHPRHKATLV